MRSLGFAAAFVAFLLPSFAHAQGAAVYQNGTVAPNHLAKWFTSGRIGDAGGLQGDVNGVGLGPFAVTDTNAFGFCSNSGPTSAAYNALCMGHDASGNALITVDSYNALGPKVLKFRINGVLYDFPGGGAGSGNVVGPSPAPSVNEIAVWNGGYGLKGGPLATSTGNMTLGAAGDSYQVMFRNQTSSDADAFYIWTCVIYQCNNPDAKGTYDLHRIVMVSPPNASAEISSALGVYFVSKLGRTGPPYSSFPTTGGLNVIGICDAVSAPGAGCWAWNSIITDGRGQTNLSVKPFVFMAGVETDFQVTSTASWVAGFMTGGTSGVQPVNAAGYSCLWLDGSTAQGTKAKWASCFTTQHGSATIFANVGTREADGANTPSQLINMYFRDEDNALQNISMASTSAGISFSASGSTPVKQAVAGSIALATPGAIFAAGTDGGFRINNRAALVANGSTLDLAPDATWTMTQVGSPGIPLNLFGVVGTPNVVTGTPVASLCLNAANVIIKKTTAGPCL